MSKTDAVQKAQRLRLAGAAKHQVGNTTKNKLIVLWGPAIFSPSAWNLCRKRSRGQFKVPVETEAAKCGNPAEQTT